MILTEDYRNLNMIDRSIIRQIDLSKNVDLDLSIDSDIEVNKVYDVNEEGKKVNHTFTKLIEILEQDDVSAIIFRVARKQMCLIGKQGVINGVKSGYSADCIVIYSSYGYNIMGNKSGYSRTKLISKSSIKQILKDIFNSAYGEDYVGSKVWDILVIKKDSKFDLKKKRLASREDIVQLPGKPGSTQDDKYRAQMNRLAYELSERLKKYKDSKKGELKFPNDVMKLFTSNENMKRIRVSDRIYQYNSRTTGTEDGIFTVYLYYMYDGETYGNKNVPDDELILTIEIGYNGIYPEVNKVYFKRATWADISKMLYNKEE